MKRKSYVVVDERSEHGRSSIDIKCPFCGQVSTAYLWSLNGCGKKCACGAKHSARGWTEKKI